MDEKKLLDEMDLKYLLTRGYVQKDYEVIPGMMTVRFRSLLAKEVKEIRRQIMQKMKEDPSTSDLDSVIFYLRKQIVMINDEPVDEATVDEKLDSMPSPIADKILTLYIQFQNEVSKLLESPDKESLKKNLE